MELNKMFEKIEKMLEHNQKTLEHNQKRLEDNQKMLEENEKRMTEIEAILNNINNDFYTFPIKENSNELIEELEIDDNLIHNTLFYLFVLPTTIKTIILRGWGTVRLSFWGHKKIE